jgi:ArsR family transcriptional regulator
MSIQRCGPLAPVDSSDRTAEAAIFKALADPHRLTILATLSGADDEYCVCDFTAGLPLEQPTVSHHVKLLRNAGLVISERRGTWVYYRLAPDARQRITDALAAVLPQPVLA